MKKLMLAAATLALVTGGAVAAQGQGRGQGDTVHISGQGRILQERTFSVNIFVAEDGSANGQAQLVRRGFPNDTQNAPIIEKVEVTCGHRIDANTYVFGGVIERSNASSLPVTRYFALRDNGNPNQGTDELTFLIPTNLGADDPLFCLQLPISAFALQDVEVGNIRIR